MPRTGDSGAPWPPVSLVVPAYQAAAWLGEALESVAAQAYPDLDLIVVDDGSTDRPEQVVARSGLPARVLRQVNQGASTAERRHRRARAELIAFLDADDRLTPGSLASRVERALAVPEADLVQGRLQRFVQSGARGRRAAAPFGPHLANLSTILFRRRVFDTVGLLDSALLLHEDMEIMMRATGAGLRWERIEDVVLLYRRGHGSLTERLAPRQPAASADLRPWLRLLHGRLQRRRAGTDETR
ncbi:MAG: glycosyltransferase family A protein [Dongiaceae bacterium]